MFGRETTKAALRPLVGDLRQVASVRRIVLDDGPERGVRALAFSTGGGLDFWALVDRSLDIGPLWFKGVPIAWQGPAGFVSPALIARMEDGGRGIERAISGLLMTCGMDHIRKPPSGVLHGRLPATPARLASYGEEWDREVPALSCEGEIVQWRLNGESLRLRRRIACAIGGTALEIVDRIENTGAAPQPLALMYHFNFGFPLVGPDTSLTVNDAEIPMPLQCEGATLPVSMRLGSGQTCCRLTGHVDGKIIEMTLAFDTGGLPFLQFWQQASTATRILSIEPCTSNRLANGASGEERLLEPGDECELRTCLSFAQPDHRPAAKLTSLRSAT